MLVMARRAIYMHHLWGMGGNPLSGPTRPFERKFFEGFSFARFLIKSIGLFLAFLGAASAFADWSLWVTELRDAVRGERFAIFVVFLTWEGLFFVYELLRLKLRHDLAHARWENRTKRAARRAKK